MTKIRSVLIGIQNNGTSLISGLYFSVKQMRQFNKVGKCFAIKPHCFESCEINFEILSKPCKKLVGRSAGRIFGK